MMAPLNGTYRVAFSGSRPSTAREVAPIRSLSKSRGVLEQFCQAIWSGALAPGTPLREAHIAKQLNLSQVPVREALLHLENLGLVIHVPDRGTTVTKLSRRKPQVRRKSHRKLLDELLAREEKCITATVNEHISSITLSNIVAD